jgi:hypothetical protein
MGLFDQLKAATDTFSAVGGIDNLIVFKRDGEATFAGIKDSFRDEDGKIVRGSDFRKSQELKSATAEQRKTFRKLLKAGTVLSDKEMELLLDEKGNLKPEAVRGDQEINKNLSFLAKLDRMKTFREDFLKTQEEREEEFNRKNDPEEGESEEDRRPPIPREDRSRADPGESGDISKNDAFAYTDREVQEWKNNLEAAYTPIGDSVGHGN